MYSTVCVCVCVQEEVYRATTKGLIEGLISGYNATVFAYGPTGPSEYYLTSPAVCSRNDL